MKVIDKKKIDDERTLRKLDTEVKLQASCVHPNILQLTGVYDDEDTRCLFMEMAEGGDLFDKIIEKVVFTEEEAKVVVKQILRALVYLHTRNIAHRDLKCVDCRTLCCGDCSRLSYTTAQGILWAVAQQPAVVFCNV